MVARQLQFEWDRPEGSKGETHGKGGSVHQVTTASKRTEPLKSVVMEEVVQRENLEKALKRVCANKGSPGIDGMAVEELKDYLKVHWPKIRQQLLQGQYKLGIPTVLDRFIQQALLQVLNRIYDPTFSPHSYGFRPGRNAHQAVRQAKNYGAQGYEWVVDIDLEKCFDRINHDMLMGRIAKRITDIEVALVPSPL